MHRRVQKKKGKYQGTKNEEAIDFWSAKRINEQYIEVSILVTKELHFKTDAVPGYEALGSDRSLEPRAIQKPRSLKSYAFERNNILRQNNSSPATRDFL